jgi:putative aldouronate transport system substrate-binding protein
MVIPTGITDVTNGYFVPSAYSSAATTANRTFLEGVNDILFSRRPMSEFDQLLKDWRNAAGDKMRQDYMTAMSA